jgi:hypothetical protein
MDVTLGIVMRDGRNVLEIKLKDTLFSRNAFSPMPNQQSYSKWFARPIAK